MQYRASWHWLFSNGGSTSTTADPHRDPTRPPAIQPGSVNVNVSSIVPLTSINNLVPGAFANRNTDEASHWRIQTSANVGAGQALATIRFGTEYRYRSGGSLVPFQPTVITNAGTFGLFVDGITSAGFTIFTSQVIAANVTLEAHIAVLGGQASEG